MDIVVMRSLPTQKSQKNEGSLSTYKGNMNETLGKHAPNKIPKDETTKENIDIVDYMKLLKALNVQKNLKKK